MASDPTDKSVTWTETALKLGFFAIRHRPWRRQLMLYISVGALLQVGLGLLIFEALKTNLFALLLYWGFCLLAVMTMVLLALYDMLAIRNEQRESLKQLQQQLLADATGPQAPKNEDPS